MDYLKEIYNQNKRILAVLENKKRQWVKVTVIVKMTGWGHEKLRIARENGSVVWKRDKKGIWYDAASIAEAHLINKNLIA